MPDNNVDQKITDKSAKEFSDSIKSGQLYEDLKRKDSDTNDLEDLDSDKSQKN